MTSVPKIDLAKLEQIHAQMERIGMPYGYGAKLDLSLDVAKIKPGTAVDCSGFTRYILSEATNGALKIPDGSQMQREWAEESGLHKVGAYADIAKYMNHHRLFIAFIKPWTNGCGAVGHVWLLSQYNDGNNGTPTGTLESCGGQGVTSRPWNTGVLVREFYSAYELPTV